MEDHRFTRVFELVLTVIQCVADNRVRVDEDMVQDWAEGTLQDWFTGYTSSDENHPQYTITHVGEDMYMVDATYPDTGHLEPRKFLVQVSVTEA